MQWVPPKLKEARTWGFLLHLALRDEYKIFYTESCAFTPGKEKDTFSGILVLHQPLSPQGRKVIKQYSLTLGFQNSQACLHSVLEGQDLELIVCTHVSSWSERYRTYTVTNASQTPYMDIHKRRIQQDKICIS